MSEFEFLAVLISVVMGLGVTNLLAGVGRTIHRRKQVRPDAVHTLWSATAFLVLILNWWVFFQWSDFPDWSFEAFLAIVLWAVALYMLSVVLYPPDMAEDEDFREVFEINRQWIMATFMVVALTDILTTAIRGDLLNPPAYTPFVLHLAVVCLAGIFIKGRRFHLIAATWLFGSLLVWSFVVRRFLQG
jgi:hypothetical protein